MKFFELLNKFGGGLMLGDEMVKVIDFDLSRQEYVYEEPYFMRQLKSWAYCEDPLDPRYQFYARYWNRTVQYLTMSVFEGAPRA